MNTHDFRPPGPPGKGDRYLREVARQVARTIRSVQREFEFETLRLTPEELSELSHILAEFAEDLHNDISIWRTYENCNREWFGVPLPITEGGGDADASAVTTDRVRHLLWVLFVVMKPELTLGPMQRDLGRLAELVADALSARIAPVPRDSGVKRFLEISNEHGWDIKKKLVWMGTRSYLFRTACRQYLAEQETDVGNDKIGPTDDFICQECTQWSGLGVLDVLAGVLPLTEEQRSVLRGWYERHAALYRIDSAGAEVLEVTNLINDQPYRVIMGSGPQPFRPGSMVFGSLVPWGEYWYWSGAQRQYSAMDDSAVEDIRQSMIAKSPSIVYRYRKDLLDQAVAATERHYREFLDYRLRSIMGMIQQCEGRGTTDTDWVAMKTQFLTADVHVWIVGLLKYLQKRCFSNLEVDDEGGFWETGDRTALEAKMRLLNDKMDELVMDLETKSLGDLTGLPAEDIASRIENYLKERQ